MVGFREVYLDCGRPDRAEAALAGILETSGRKAEARKLYLDASRIADARGQAAQAREWAGRLK